MYQTLIVLVVSASAVSLLGLLGGCRACPQVERHVVEPDVPTTMQIDSIHTRFPVAIRQVHPPKSPADTFSALLAPATEPDDPPEEHVVFRVKDGNVIAVSPDSFIYMSGTRPGAKTDNTDVASDTTVVLIHIREELERVYVLKMDELPENNKGVTVKSRRGQQQQIHICQAFRYVDVVIDEDGVQQMIGPRDMPEEDEDDPDNVRGFAVFAVEIAVREGFDHMDIP